MTSTITQKGQVTIPKTIRDQMGLHLGDRVHLLVRDNEIVLRPVRRTILDLQGSVTAHSRPEDFDRVRKTARDKQAKRIAEGG